MITEDFFWLMLGSYYYVMIIHFGFWIGTINYLIIFLIMLGISNLISNRKPNRNEPKLKIPKKISFDIKDKDGKNKRVTFKSRRG